MFETLFWWLLIAFVGVSIFGVGAFLFTRWLFLRIATRMSQSIDRRIGGVTTHTFTRLAKYAKANGVDLPEANRQLVRHIDRLARLMDSAVRLPLIGPVGLDAALGLVPVVGDVLGSSISLLLVARSLQYGPPAALISQMLANVLTDLILGAIPVIGVLADVWFKANERNAQLLRTFLEGRSAQV